MSLGLPFLATSVVSWQATRLPENDVSGISDRLVVMSAGKVEQIGAPREVFERPASAFVADFMGFSNLVPITVNGQGRGPLRSGLDVTIDDTSPLRGEQITLSPKPPQGFENSATVTIEALTYRSSFVDYLVRLDDDNRLQVRGATQSPVSPGERTFIAWRPDAGVLVEARAS